MSSVFSISLSPTKTNWLPSSHFYVEKDVESILHTLELYYIVSKFNEGSSRKPGKKVSYFGLNYGLCLENMIDYGKPELRRSYNYWRQDEFDYTDFIPAILNAVEVTKCTKYGYEYKHKNEYEIAKWKSECLPDIEIDILRVLYNNKNIIMTAAEIGMEVERHHLGVTKIMNKLKRYGYISFEIREKRYYKIEENVVQKFFSE